EDLAPAPSSNAWLWLVAAGTLVIVAVLLGPQLFANGPIEATQEEKTDAVVGQAEAEAGADPEVVDPALPPEPERVHVPVTNDPAVVVSRAQVALTEGRFTEPLGDNLAEHLQQLAKLEPNNEAIAGLRRKAAEQLLPKANDALAKKLGHEAAIPLRQLLAIWPDNPDVVRPFTDAVIMEGKILRAMKSWNELLPIAEELAQVNPKSFEGAMLRGQALAGLNRWADAGAAYKVASEIRPKDKGAKQALGEAKKKAAGK
ncbi:MAG: hypothetical protein H0T76_27485, partial [Nannocystis sp.]